jgi:hypothetical protein
MWVSATRLNILSSLFIDNLGMRDHKKALLAIFQTVVKQNKHVLWFYIPHSLSYLQEIISS